MKLLTLIEVAEILRVSPRTIYTRINDGSLPAFKFGGVWRIGEQVVEELMRGRVATDGQSGSEEMRAV